MTATKNREILEQIIELMQHPFYWKGIHVDGKIDEERKAASDRFNALHAQLEKDYKSFKKGDKVLMIVSPDRFKKVSRKDLFLSRGENPPAKSFIVTVEISAPIKTRIKKNQWVGDGYEDVSVTTMKYIDENYIVTTQFPMSLHMVKL